MPKVPTYDAPQVTPSALGAPRTDYSGPKSVADTADFFGAVQGKQEEALGRAGVQAGATAGDIISKMQVRENEDTTLRSLVQAKDEALQFENDARDKRQGRFAVDLTSDADKFWGDISRKYSEKLTPVQQRMFAERLAPVRQSSLHSISHFQAVQLEKSADESIKADNTLAVSAAAKDPTDENVTLGLDTIRKNNGSMAARKGWDKSQLEKQTLVDTTQLHKQVIQSLSDPESTGYDPSRAALYFDQHKNEIDGAQHYEISKFVRDTSAASLGQTVGAAVVQQLAPDNDREPFELDKMEEKINAAIPNNPKAREAAIHFAREKAQVRDYSIKQRDHALGAEVFKAMKDGTPFSDILKLPAFNNLSEDRQDAFMQMNQRREEHAGNIAYQKTARAAAEESRLYTRENRVRMNEERVQTGNYWAIRANPDALAATSDEEIMAKAPELGFHHVAELLEVKKKLDKPDKVFKATIDMDSFKEIARNMKLDPDAKKGTDDARRVGAALNEVEAEIGRKQQTEGRELDRDERDDIARKVLGKTVMRPTLWTTVTGGLISGVETPAAALLLDDIPKSEQNAIREGFKKRGKKATDADVVRIYKRKQLSGE